jgi:hypothetical protein
MLIAAGVIGGAGLIVRLATTAAVIRTIRDDGPSPLGITAAGGYLFNPLVATGLGLAGGGMARRGRLDAHQELFEGIAAERPRRKKLGWGLFGGGVGLWAITRVAGVTACNTEACAARVWEWGYYLSLAGTVPGVIMGGYASGYDRYHRRFGHLSDLSLAPIAHRQGFGLAVSGRF